MCARAGDTTSGAEAQRSFEWQLRRQWV